MDEAGTPKDSEGVGLGRTFLARTSAGLASGRLDGLELTTLDSSEPGGPPASGQRERSNLSLETHVTNVL